MSELLPTLSVVMSCYNAEQTVERAIESILAQSYNSFEFLIIDDASTDRTIDILTQYARTDSRIRLMQNDINKGLSYSLNRGIKAAKTQIIVRMDADDFAYPNRFFEQYKFLVSNPKVDILGSAVRYVDDTGKMIKDVVLPVTHENIVKRIFKKTMVLHPTIMIRKRVYENKGLYNPNLRWAEDADLWYRIYDQVTFHNLPDVLLEYTLKSSISQRILWNNLKVKWMNLKKRDMIPSHFHLIIKDLITLSLRRVKNY